MVSSQIAYLLFSYMLHYTWTPFVVPQYDGRNQNYILVFTTIILVPSSLVWLGSLQSLLSLSIIKILFPIQSHPTLLFLLDFLTLNILLSSMFEVHYFLYYLWPFYTMWFNESLAIFLVLWSHSPWVSQETMGKLAFSTHEYIPDGQVAPKTLLVSIKEYLAWARRVK